MRYLSVNVYKTDYDCSNNGISKTHPNRLVVPCAEGNISLDDVERNGYIILSLNKFITGNNIYRSFSVAGDNRWLMFGGAFVYSTDSRFSRTYGNQPIALHDRYEG